MTRRPVAWVIVMALVVAACSGTAQPPGATQPAGGGGGGPTAAAGGGGGAKPDPCSLLSPADLQKTLGSAFQAGHLVGTTSAPHVECEWAKEGGTTAALSLSVDDLASKFGCIGDVKVVSALGDEACFGGGGLHVKHGSYELAFLGSEGITDQQLIDLAKVALSHV